MSRPAQTEAPPLPHNLEAERSVLGGIILDNHLLVAAMEHIRQPEEFFLSQHVHIFSQMLALNQKNIPIDVITLMEALEAQGELEAAGGVPYLSQLTDGLPALTNVGHYAKIVVDKAALRELAHLGQNLLDGALANGADASALMRRLTESLARSRARRDEESESQLGSLSTAELFTAQETKVEWLAWPFASVGLATVLDALPKAGKTILFLHGIQASRADRPFLGAATKPMRVLYVSEQSAASLAMQARQVGFTGSEPVEELRWITREFWSRFIFAEFLERLERQFLREGSYNTLIFDTWHTIARLVDEKDASEVNRLGNLTIDVAARNKLALALGRHDRKSGGEVGLSGRSSIQLSGLVDVILHLVRVSGNENQRRLEILGRVPGLPAEQIIELVDGTYINRGAPEAMPDETAERIRRVEEWLLEFPSITSEEIMARFARMNPPIEISLATAKRYKRKAQGSPR